MSHWDVDDSEQLKVLGAALKFRRAELDEAKAELARLTALLEDRESMAKMLFEYWAVPIPHKYSWDEIGNEQKGWLGLADRLIAYLKPLG